MADEEIVIKRIKLKIKEVEKLKNENEEYQKSASKKRGNDEEMERIEMDGCWIADVVKLLNELIKK